MDTVKISKKEERALRMLQHMYHHAASMTPQNISQLAGECGIDEETAEYLSGDSFMFEYKQMGDIYVYKWKPAYKDGAPITPNLHMVRAMLNDIKSRRNIAEQTREESKRTRTEIRKSGYAGRMHVMTDKLMVHMRDNAQDWTAMSISKVAAEMSCNKNIPMIIVRTGAVLSRGSHRNTEYRWNPKAEYSSETVSRVYGLLVEYTNNKRRDIPRLFDDPGSQTAAPKMPSSENVHPAIAEVKKQESPVEQPRYRIGHMRWKWSSDEEWAIIQGIREGLNPSEIGKILGRSYAATYARIKHMEKENMLDIQDKAELTDKPRQGALENGVRMKDMPSKGEFNQGLKEVKVKSPSMFKRIWKAIMNKQ